MQQAIVNDLISTLGESKVSFAEAVRQQHSQDESTYPAVLPDVVVYPENTQDVSDIAKFAFKHKIAMTAWGAGTSLEGHSIPLKGGISLNFERMNQIVQLHAEDFQVSVQPGILRKELESKLGRHGLMFGPDPGANASIGGMIANNAAGIRTVKYGATKDNILALEFVLADGTIVKSGSRSLKQSAGYDLTRLLIGSEGTLALITEATLKLVPIPEHYSTAIIAFESIPQAAEAVYNIRAYGLEPAALELIHPDMLSWINEDEGQNFTVAPSIMLEFSGASEEAVKTAMSITEGICEDLGSQGFKAGLGRDARQEMWSYRHSIRERIVRRFPGHKWVLVDIAVPLSKFPELVAYAQAQIDLCGFDSRIIGHAGDGNVHTGIHFAADDVECQSQAKALSEKLVFKAQELEGTCTGEHGIGLGKQKYLKTERGGEAALDLMRLIKQALDPFNLLNPGKILSQD